MHRIIRSTWRNLWLATACAARMVNAGPAAANGPLASTLTGFDRAEVQPIPMRRDASPAKSTNDGRFAALRGSVSWKIALAPHPGGEELDEQIRKSQNTIRKSADPRAYLERLGWLYVAKARASHDPGFYKLAEHCAMALDATDSRSLEALLLRGHVAQSLHRFKEAESIGRELVARRELAFDHGLLGDALADQGKLPEAIAQYQQMVDLRPDLQSYSRVAHMRWLKGDLAGAIEAAELAVSAGSPADAESAAWASTRLAGHRFQLGDIPKAESACKAALQFMTDYPPALLLQGRILLHTGRFADAAAIIRRAAERNPLPEYQWALADALRAANRTNEAIAVEAQLTRTGAADDPRTFALFLATRGCQVSLALRLAERELKERADVFTHDALAWAQFNAGRSEEAWTAMELALAEGTRDARLYLHAGVIAAQLRRDDAPHWLAKAEELERLLLPSERRRLDDALQFFNRKPGQPGASLSERADAH